MEGGLPLTNPVISGAGYVLVHTPGIMMTAGTTQVLEKENPNSQYYEKAFDHIRDFEDALAYAPNQVYIGNMTIDELKNYNSPWYKNPIKNAERFGKFGEIMPEDEFFGLLAMSDSFELVELEENFAETIKKKLLDHPMFSEEDIKKIRSGVKFDEIEKQLKNGAIELKYNDKIVGCVRKAHDRDDSLKAHVMLENLSTKASAVLTLKHLLRNSGKKPEDIDYIIECSEEACGDMNQRGGGNFAKAIGEVVGCDNATGSDIRGFCAGPAHALVSAAALVSSGIFKNVAVVGGGCVAKLGMNGRDHVKKGMPLLEDMLGGIAILVSENDGKNPIIRTDAIGKHSIGTGSSPQAVIQSIVFDPLDKINIKAEDVDKFAPELQNPEITVPAGAGDVANANFKMIAALAVRRGEIDRKEMMDFVEAHGMPGFAPTQGHIPSGVPFIGHARDMILADEMKRAMIIGKGSLFLGRMTDLFDGISLIIEKNTGIDKSEEVEALDMKELAEAFREFADYLKTRGKVDDKK